MLSPEQLVVVILGVVGVALQLIFRYAPKVSDWYAKQPNKGLLMLAFVVVTSLVYFLLSCTPYAVLLKISLSCDAPSAFVLLQAVFIIATGQSLAYLYTGKKE